MNHLEQLKWRYAVKRMTGEKIAKENLASILNAILLTPTSLGLQPLKILVVQSKENKEKLAQACQQPQILESSEVLVFCAWDKFYPERLDKYLENIAQTRGQEPASLAPFKALALGYIDALNEATFKIWAARQAYIALGFGLYAAALESVDSTPIEGFNPETLDNLFDLKTQGLQSVVLLALGKRDTAKDYLANAKKVRKPFSEYFEIL